MENFTIEKMEIKRFNALLVRTIASTLLLGWIAWWIYCIDNNESTWGMSYFNAFVLLIYAAVAWKTSATLEKIRMIRGWQRHWMVKSIRCIITNLWLRDFMQL